MIILIAESKTMTACDSHISHEEYVAHTPPGEKIAGEIMNDVSEMPVNEISRAAKLSLPMAQKCKRLAYEFPNKASGEKAIEAYTGVVFKALDFNSMKVEAKSNISSKVRIISSRYGLLSPTDIIKAYRLDYTTPFAPDGKSLISYWKDKITSRLLEELSNETVPVIIDLLPGDAAKGLDRKKIEKKAEIIKIDFKELIDGGAFRTPSSNRLKELRGHLLREIAIRGISSPSQLRLMETGKLIPMESDAGNQSLFCLK